MEDILESSRSELEKGDVALKELAARLLHIRAKNIQCHWQCYWGDLRMSSSTAAEARKSCCFFRRDNVKCIAAQMVLLLRMSRVQKNFWVSTQGRAI